MSYHLSIFMENKPGKLDRILGLLSQNEIDLRAITMASSGEYGVIKILTSDVDRAFQVLQSNGFAVSRRKILVAVVEDKPGGLHGLLRVLSARNVNVEDCYGFVIEAGRKAAIVIETEKYPEAEEILASADFTLLTDREIYSF